jgi:hypothetical protein
VYPGNQHTVNCFQPAVMGSEKALALSPAQRKRTVWRFDGGAGSDEQFIWLLKRGYHVIGKGASNRRAKALARQVSRWDAYGDVWLGEVPPPVDYGRPTRVFIKKRLKDDRYRHSYYVTTLSLPSKGHFIRLYDQRGGAEVEQFRNDKNGLNMTARRKRSFTGQKGYIALTDLAHNLLADLYHQVLIEGPFETYGPKRIVRDLFNTAGKLIFDGESLTRIELQKQKPASEALLACLEKYCSDG